MANEIITTEEFRLRTRQISERVLAAFASEEVEPSDDMTERLAIEIENWALHAPLK